MDGEAYETDFGVDSFSVDDFERKHCGVNSDDSDEEGRPVQKKVVRSQLPVCSAKAGNDLVSRYLADTAAKPQQQLCKELTDAEYFALQEDVPVHVHQVQEPILTKCPQLRVKDTHDTDLLYENFEEYDPAGRYPRGPDDSPVASEGGLSDAADPALRLARDVESGVDSEGRYADLGRRVSEAREELSEVQELIAELTSVRNDGSLTSGEGNLRRVLLDAERKHRRLVSIFEANRKRLEEFEKNDSLRTAAKNNVSEKPTLNPNAETFRSPANSHEALALAETERQENEEFRKKYLALRNKLQDERRELGEMKKLHAKRRKVLLKEMKWQLKGSESCGCRSPEALYETALAAVEDPFQTSWMGAAKSIEKLKKELNVVLKATENVVVSKEDDFIGRSRAGSGESFVKSLADTGVSARHQHDLGTLAKKREEQIALLRSENEKMEVEKSGLTASSTKAKIGDLEGQVRELRSAADRLRGKSENDAELLKSLRKQNVELARQMEKEKKVAEKRDAELAFAGRAEGGKRIVDAKGKTIGAAHLREEAARGIILEKIKELELQVDRQGQILQLTKKGLKPRGIGIPS